jgi:hypothetical protein
MLVTTITQAGEFTLIGSQRRQRERSPEAGGRGTADILAYELSNADGRKLEIKIPSAPISRISGSRPASSACSSGSTRSSTSTRRTAISMTSP